MKNRAKYYLYRISGINQHCIFCDIMSSGVLANSSFIIHFKNMPLKIYSEWLRRCSRHRLDVGPNKIDLVIKNKRKYLRAKKIDEGSFYEFCVCPLCANKLIDSGEAKIIDVTERIPVITLHQTLVLIALVVVAAISYYLMVAINWILRRDIH